MQASSSFILVVTGETSGDRHAGGVIREFGKRHPELPVDWSGSGGSHMVESGARLLFHVSGLGAIGPWAAMANLGNYVSLYRTLLRKVRSRRPDLALLVDFPDFNLRLARRLKALGIPVCYFIGPQVWAWRPARVKDIHRYVDRMFVIFPFEEEFYRSRGVSATYVGNPSAGVRSRLEPCDDMKPERDRPLVALMPGSRPKEIQQILPVQLEAAACLNRQLPSRFWILKARDTSHSALETLCRNWLVRERESLQVEVRREASAEALPLVDCAIIKSGTSTLEAMLLEVPFVMVYRMAWLSYRLLRPWVATDVYCLANWVAGSRIVPEFVQDQAVGADIASCLLGLLKDPAKRDKMKQNLRIASERLGKQEAHARVADEIASFLRNGSFV